MRPIRRTWYLRDLLFRCCPEGMHFRTIRQQTGLPNDLSGIIDGVSIQQVQLRVRWYQRVEVADFLVDPDHGMRAGVIECESDDYPVVVDGAAATGDCSEGSRKGLEILHAFRSRPQERVAGAVGELRGADNLAKIVDAAGAVERGVGGISQCT